MKRSGFKPKTLEQVIEKQAIKRAKKLATPSLERSKLTTKPLKRKKATKVRSKLPKVSTMRNKCDALLTPLIKKMYPECLLTGAPTEVAHHHVKKSESNALRYYIPNLIPLTHKAHMALHSHETLYSSKIVAIKGLDWWADIEREKQKIVKIDRQWYEGHLARLRALLDGE